MTISQIVLHLTSDHWHRVGAECMAPRGIKALQSLDQAKATKLKKIVVLN